MNVPTTVSHTQADDGFKKKKVALKRGITI